MDCDPLYIALLRLTQIQRLKESFISADVDVGIDQSGMRRNGSFGKGEAFTWRLRLRIKLQPPSGR